MVLHEGAPFCHGIYLVGAAVHHDTSLPVQIAPLHAVIGKRKHFIASAAAAKAPKHGPCQGAPVETVHLPPVLRQTILIGSHAVKFRGKKKFPRPVDAALPSVGKLHKSNALAERRQHLPIQRRRHPISTVIKNTVFPLFPVKRRALFSIRKRHAAICGDIGNLLSLLHLKQPISFIGHGIPESRNDFMSLPVQEPPALFIPKRSGDTLAINITFPPAPVNIAGKAVLCQVGIQQASRRRRRRQVHRYIVMGGLFR